MLDLLDKWCDETTIDESIGLEPWLKNLIDELQKILDRLNDLHKKVA